MDLLSPLIGWLPAYGPWLVFVLVVLETSFITGLVVPASVATSVATVLAMEGSMALAPVVMAAAAGAFLGDSLGFWVGRVTEHRLEAGTGRFSRKFAEHHERLDGFHGRHPIYSVTVARLVSFVRTLMPMAAGISGMAYPRYLLYQIPGLVGWLAIYVGVGVLAGESWEVAVQTIGAGGTLIFIGVGAALWWTLKRRGGTDDPGAGAPC